MIVKVGKGLEPRDSGWDGAVAEGLCQHQVVCMVQMQLNSQQNMARTVALSWLLSSESSHHL